MKALLLVLAVRPGQLGDIHIATRVGRHFCVSKADSLFPPYLTRPVREVESDTEAISRNDI